MDNYPVDLRAFVAELLAETNFNRGPARLQAEMKRRLVDRLERWVMDAYVEAPGPDEANKFWHGVDEGEIDPETYFGQRFTDTEFVELTGRALEIFRDQFIAGALRGRGQLV